MLHRDIKPSNIIVHGDGADLTAELVDFGLSRGADLDGASRGEPTGTVRYIAPEAAGLINVVVDQRSDLYSLGVVVFECLAGHAPFSGDTVGEVLRQHLNADAPPLRSLGIAVPRSLDGVLHRLLAKDPGGRYQSAASVLDDLTEIAAGLEAGLAEPAVTPGLRDRRQVLAEPAFIGRREEMAELVAVLDREPVAACSGWCWWRPTPARARPGSSTSWRCTPRSVTSSCCAARASTRPPRGRSRCSRASLTESS